MKLGDQHHITSPLTRALVQICRHRVFLKEIRLSTLLLHARVNLDINVLRLNTSIRTFTSLQLMQALSVSTEMFQHQPSGIYRHSPKSKVEIYGTNFGEEGQRSETVAHGLPCRFSTAEKSSVSDDFGLVACKIIDEEVPFEKAGLVNEARRWTMEVEAKERKRLGSFGRIMNLQKQVLHLEARCEEHEDSKRFTESWTGPVVCWLRNLELCD